MRTSIIFLFLAVLIGCKEKKETAVNPFILTYAGQYLIQEDGNSSRTVSQRYILTPGGDAELHRLERTSIYGDYRLDKIIRGNWRAEEGRIEIELDQDEPLRESFRQQVRRAPADSLKSDTLWINHAQPGRTLKLLIRF